jgi:hypothetical protein
MVFALCSTISSMQTAKELSEKMGCREYNISILQIFA